MNKVILFGNLGADPEIGETQNGKQKCKMSIATTKRWSDSEGVRQEKTTWHTVMCFGRLAEICGQYLSKGRKVCVEGSLEKYSFQDDDGNNKTFSYVKGEQVEFDKNPGNQPAARDYATAPSLPPQGRQAPPPRQAPPQAASRRLPPPDDDDIPF